MSKFSKIIATLAVLPVVALSGSTVFAGSPGQLAGGNDYQVKDLTQNSAYSSSISASCGDTVEYSMLVSNTQYGALTNVTLNANLPSAGGQSTLVATTDLGGTSGATSSVTVNLPANATQTLENGTTLLYNSSDTVIETLPNTITSSGVNIGTVEGSATEFVNFKAQVSCAVTPATPVYTCDELTVSTTSDNKIVTVSALKTTATNGATFNNATINWGDNTSTTTVSNVAGVTHQYAAVGTYTITATANFTVNGKTETATSDACKQQVVFSSTPTTTTTTSTPTALVNTGAGNTIGIFAAVSAVSAIAYRVVVARRLSRQ